MLDFIDIDSALRKDIVAAYENQSWEVVFENLEKGGIFVNHWSLEPALIDVGFSKDIFEAMQQCDTGPRILNSMRSDIQNDSISEERIEYWVNKIDDEGKGRIGQRLSANLLKSSSGAKAIPDYIQKAFDYLIKILDTSNHTTEEELVIIEEE